MDNPIAVGDARQGMRKRNLLLVVLPYLVAKQTDTKQKGVRSFLAFPYGVLTIASYIRRESMGFHEAKILDLNTTSSLTEEERIREAILAEDINVVGFSMSYDISFRWLLRFSAFVRKNFPGILQVAGGPAVTTGYGDIIDEGVELDALCFSEGEVGLLRLLNADDPEQVLNADPWIRNHKAKLHNSVPHPSTGNLPKVVTWARNERGSSLTREPHAVTENLDKVINVDYELVDVKAYSMKEAFSPFVKFASNSRQFFLVTSRGCPFKCNFCAEPMFHGSGMRYASVDLIIDHVAGLIDKYGLNVLTIYDDQLLMNKVRAKELFRKLARFNIRIEMPNGVTLSYIDEELAALMRNAGVDTIFLAIESGSKRVLKEIIQKPIAFDRIKPTVNLLREKGIFTCAFFVIGLPGETDEERQETRRFVLDTGFDWALFNYATPLRGSRLFEQCKQNGWLAPEHQRIGAVDMSDYVINAPGINKEQLKRFMFDLNLESNFVKNRNLQEGNNQLAATTFGEVINRHENQPFAHYFLSEAYEGMGQQFRDKAVEHYRRFLEIVNEDAEWFQHAKRWGLDFSRNARASCEGREYPALPMTAVRNALRQ